MAPQVNKDLGFKEHEDIPDILLPLTDSLSAPMVGLAEQETFSLV